MNDRLIVTEVLGSDGYGVFIEDLSELNRVAEKYDKVYFTKDYDNGLQIIGERFETDREYHERKRLESNQKLQSAKAKKLNNIIGTIAKEDVVRLHSAIVSVVGETILCPNCGEPIAPSETRAKKELWSLFKEVAGT
jgi:hypothetical protein